MTKSYPVTDAHLDRCGVVLGAGTLAAMRYRMLGRTGLEVSEIGLGCGFLAWDESFDFSRLFTRARALNITTYDTGDFYCDYQSEVWIGRAFATERSRVVRLDGGSN